MYSAGWYTCPQSAPNPPYLELLAGSNVSCSQIEYGCSLYPFSTDCFSRRDKTHFHKMTRRFLPDGMLQNPCGHIYPVQAVYHGCWQPDFKLISRRSSWSCSFRDLSTRLFLWTKIDNNHIILLTFCSASHGIFSLWATVNEWYPWNFGNKLKCMHFIATFMAYGSFGK